MFYIKPQLVWATKRVPKGCFFWMFYIKPQPCLIQGILQTVVSFGCSTSNHNLYKFNNDHGRVVSFGCSTSNHNFWNTAKVGRKLFLLDVLHQTTTELRLLQCCARCFFWMFYIKPQHMIYITKYITSCFFWMFYIKPQLNK